MTVTLETQLENYTLEKEIGRGDLTMVYQARRKSDDALVAIKIVPPQFTFDEVFVRRFQDAARQAIKLEHPNIVRTYETGQEDDVLYIVRELVEGRSLAKIMADEGPLAPERALVIAQQIASALDYAHQKSINQGDLSANRVYVGLNDYTIVADFGQTQAMAGTSLVKQGFAVGAPETTAPERVHGQGPTRQSDLYSLGILCYQMLAGTPPFTGTPTAVLHAQAYEQPRPFHLVNPTIPIALSETVGRMLSKGLELRYNTGSEFIRALEVAQKGTAPLRAPAAAAAQLKAAGINRTPLWRRPWLWLMAAILVIAFLWALGFGAVSLWRVRQPQAAVVPPTEVISQSTTLPTTANQNEESITSAENTPAPIVVAATLTPTFIPVSSATPAPPPTATPTFVPIPTPGPPTIVQDSPFTNLVLAHAISEASEPQRVGTSFTPGPEPVYLFFDYDGIQAGDTWTHRWTWGDTELDSYQEVWPENFTETGTAWVFYNPAGGFQTGPYKVTLEVNGQTVATATFVIEPGGL
jgi:serine/threonine protein kinase